MKRILLVTILLISSSVFAAQPQPQDKIDLINAKINNNYLFSMSMDKLTDNIGRPMIGEKGDVSKELAAYISTVFNYFNKGLSFWFNSPKVDKKELCYCLHIYLTKTFDKQNNDYFLPFRGFITDGVTINSKKKDILKLFSKYKPEDEYSPEKEKKIEETYSILGPGAVKTEKENLYMIIINQNNHHIEFKYDPVSNFINEIILIKKM